MADSPSLSDTLIDNIITRKQIRDDALRRLRARDRINIAGIRNEVINNLIEFNGAAPLSKILLQQQLGPEDFPEHLALVPDGNRRFARSRSKPVGYGYAVGSRRLEDFRRWAMIDNNVEVASCFTLSTENIERRPEDQLAQLFDVFAEFFNRAAENKEVHDNEIKHEVRGNSDSLNKLPDRVLDAIDNMEQATEDFSNRRIIFLLGYGGRDEIIQAARQTNTPLGDQSAINSTGEDDTEFRSHLMLGDLPDVDLMVRTSEVRLSNFMLYHNAYSEFVFLQKNWPSFTEADFYESIYKYANRDRRFGV